MDCSLPGSKEFSKQEYQSELPFPTPGNLPDPEIEPTSPALAGTGSRILYLWAIREFVSVCLHYIICNISIYRKQLYMS